MNGMRRSTGQSLRWSISWFRLVQQDKDIHQSFEVSYYTTFRCYNWNSYWTQPLYDDIREQFCGYYWTIFVDITEEIYLRLQLSDIAI